MFKINWLYLVQNVKAFENKRPAMNLTQMLILLLAVNYNFQIVGVITICKPESGFGDDSSLGTRSNTNEIMNYLVRKLAVS